MVDLRLRIVCSCFSTAIGLTIELQWRFGQQPRCLNQLGMCLAMHPAHLGRRLAEPRQLLHEGAVMGGLQVIDQLGRSERDPVVGRCLRNRKAVQLGCDGLGI